MGSNTGNISTSTAIDGSSQSEIAEVPLRIQAGLVVLYSCTSLLSIVGNLIVIIVFLISTQPRTTLRMFLASLAVSDLVMAVFCMPFTFSYTMLNRWVFGPFICTLVLFMQSVSVIASVGSVTVIAVERYVAVTHPLRRATYTPLHERVVLGSVWVVAGVISSSQLSVGGMVDSPAGGGNWTVSVPECVETWPDPQNVWRTGYTFFMLITTYVLPICVIGLCYGAVSRNLSRQKIPGHPDELRDNIRLKSRRRVIKMLTIVTTLFGLCWFPLHLFTVISDFKPELRSEGKVRMDDIVSVIYVTVHWLAMSNSFVNPIIYSFLNDGFRRDLKWLQQRICGGRKGNGNDQTGHTVNPFAYDSPKSRLRRGTGTNIVGIHNHLPPHGHT